MTKPHPNSPEGKARDLIDKRLEDSGWTIIKEGNPVPNRGNFAVEEVETDAGPMDYGLIIDGILLGDIEAKPEGTGVPGIIAQDERYSRSYSAGKLDFDGYHIPFLYSSNGHMIWYRDARSKNNLQREVAKFHTPAALQEYFSRNVDDAHKWLKDNPIDVPGTRPYQKEAIESVESAIFANKTKLILAMATGTGKTFTSAELIYRLLKSKTAKRILFLVDRRALAAQAVREFAAFEPEPAQKLDKLYEVYSQRFRKEDLADSGFDPHVLPNEYLTNPKSNHTFVYVCTIQRMMINLFGRRGMFAWTEEDEYEDDVDQLDIPVHAFDFVIADECHRGYTAGEESKWREVLNHFDAVKIGLTATHDGITYGDYIEQLTYLLFLKMVQEKDIMMPKGCSWNDLIQYSGSELLEGYSKILQTLAKEKGMLGDIFAQSLSKFNNPTNLKKLLNLINEIEWTSLDVDIKAAAYEGLLEKYAAEEKGAGQYFTPRVVIRSILKCVRPDFRRSSDYTIHDPACGTGGFLIGAFEWIMKETDNGSKLTIKDRERLVKNTFSGMDIVQNTRRLALMNCYLHELEATIYYGDSLGEGPHIGKRYNVILTNPPFGTRGAGGAPSRDDFLVTTSNKQLNFVQHAMTLLKTGGQAAIVIPDNVLFDNSGREVRENLMKSCNLHTILRLPEGTFSPYSTGVKANVIFFTKGQPTQEVWIYDLRTNIENINKGNPLENSVFEDFEVNYNRNPRKETERFKKFTKADIEKRDYSLDIFWLKDTFYTDYANLPDPLDLAGEAAQHLETALDSVNRLLVELGNRNKIM